MSEETKVSKIKGDPREAALDDLFKNYEDETLNVIDLPSKGKFYPNFQGVEVMPLTYLDEQKIINSRDGKTDLVSRLLEKSIKGVDVDNLLTMDKMFLLMKVREASYGDSYDFRINCPSCKTEIKTSLNLSQHLNMTQVPDDLDDPRKITLPKLGVEVEVRFPRSKEEQFLGDYEMSFKNLYRFVVSINGNPDPVFISKALKRMSIRDIKKIIMEVNKGDYGIDPRFIFECPECNYEDTLAVPMDVTFFSVS